MESFWRCKEVLIVMTSKGIWRMSERGICFIFWLFTILVFSLLVIYLLGLKFKNLKFSSHPILPVTTFFTPMNHFRFPLSVYKYKYILILFLRKGSTLLCTILIFFQRIIEISPYWHRASLQLCNILMGIWIVFGLLLLRMHL